VQLGGSRHVTAPAGPPRVIGGRESFVPPRSRRLELAVVHSLHYQQLGARRTHRFAGRLRAEGAARRLAPLRELVAAGVPFQSHYLAGGGVIAWPSVGAGGAAFPRDAIYVDDTLRRIYEVGGGRNGRNTNSSCEEIACARATII